MTNKNLQTKPTFSNSLLTIMHLYWGSDEKLFAWTGVATLVILSLLGVATALAINDWYRYFYNAIQNTDIELFYNLIFIFFGIVSFSVLRSVSISYLVDLLALRWRRWLTKHYLAHWTLVPINTIQADHSIDNPDQRIAEDINKFTFETIDLGCGLIFTIASIISFSVVLIEISGEIKLTGITVPCYMFFSAITYATAGTYISQKIGFKLVSLSNHQQRSEADLRYSLIKLQENDKNFRTPPIQNDRQNTVKLRLDATQLNMRKIINLKMRLSLFTETYSQLALVLSSLLAAPRLFSGSITFGDFMQINSAFGNLSGNLSWFINAYHRLADWKATTDRLIAFHNTVVTASAVT
ncbi:hypothetical protein J3P95_18575 [Pseudomonas sp. Z5-35]|uniref:SbmA/BacA-like family transporter n=1 Tax=unclassified Pseudomonas TaxID=196821 RepID=UPI003DA9EBA0